MLYTVFAIAFLLVMVYWALGWWISINDNYPLKDYPFTHIFLKTLIVVVFFPVVLFMTCVLLVSGVSNDKE